MNKLHQTLIFLSVICFASSTNAEYFKSGNIYYNVNGTDAEVVSDWENFVPTYYSGDIVIPATISYKGGIANVIAIASGAFNSCSEPLTVSLPEGLRYIVQDAFYNCTGLESIVIPSSTISIGPGAFINCVNLESLIFSNGIKQLDAWAFQNCSALQGITFPESLEYVSTNAFKDCSALKEITFTSNTAPFLTFSTPQDSPFEGCASISKVNFGAKCILAVSTRKLKELFTSSYVSEFNVFDGNPVMRSHDGVIYSADNVSLINFPWGKAGTYSISNGTKRIEDLAFYYSEALNSVYLPESLEEIGEYAFQHSAISSITFPSKTNDIGYAAFFGCENIREVYCRSAIPPRASDDTFDDFTYQNATLYIPQDAPDADEEGSYEKAYCWRNFKTIKRKDMASVDNIPYDEQYGYVYDISGREKAQGLLNDIIPQLGNGIYIVNSGSRSYKIRIQ